MRFSTFASFRESFLQRMEDRQENDGFQTSISTSSSSAVATATASSGENGPVTETDVQTSGNATGTATATVGDQTDTTTSTSGDISGRDGFSFDFSRFERPDSVTSTGDEMVEATTTSVSIARGVATATSGSEPTVDLFTQGDASAAGSATVDDVTVTDMTSSFDIG